GLYPNCGTSRDYGYGVMGFPTFTFETDDEQFVPGSFESLHSRLAEELDVMRYLINKVWYWRARLDVTSLEVNDGSVSLDVTNHGYASTTNASLEYRLEDGSIAWASDLFNVNASTSKTVDLPFDGATLSPGGSWHLYYQKRVIDASTWVNETVPAVVVDESGAADGEPMPIATAPLLVVSLLAAIVAERRNGRERSAEDATED
ncbi:MAG: hypothetical protein VXW74_01205, partial [Candidatus Thermoplasmatota archaeon]|nr:hypothetical protein [Candidatus Thermoplasmatota archaeon]